MERIPHLGEEPRRHEISEIRIRFQNPERGGVVGHASCVLDRAFFLNDIVIRRARAGRLYLSYPSARSNQNIQHFHWSPMSKRASEVLEGAILGRLREVGGAACL